MKFSELCELCASVVNASSLETRNNLFYSPNISKATARALRRRIDIAAVVDSFRFC